MVAGTHELGAMQLDFFQIVQSLGILPIPIEKMKTPMSVVDLVTCYTDTSRWTFDD